jgi:cytoskeletal protein CcmA (bactofilin family)
VSGKIDNVIGANTSFSGAIKSDGNIRVDGVVQGTIETTGNVVVGTSARVLADISAQIVQVWGAVRGNIAATGRLEILPNGRVWGDVQVASLHIDEGGVFRGQCTMLGDRPKLLMLAGAAKELPLADLEQEDAVLPPELVESEMPEG